MNYINEYDVEYNKSPLRGGVYTKLINNKYAGTGVEKPLDASIILGVSYAKSIIPIDNKKLIVLIHQLSLGDMEEKRRHTCSKGKVYSFDEFQEVKEWSRESLQYDMSLLGIDDPLELVNYTLGLINVIKSKKKVHIECESEGEAEAVYNLIVKCIMNASYVPHISIGLNVEISTHPTQFLVTSVPYKYYLTGEREKVKFRDLTSKYSKIDLADNQLVNDTVNKMQEFLLGKELVNDNYFFYKIRENEFLTEEYLELQKKLQDLLKKHTLTRRNKERYFKVLIFSFENVSQLVVDKKTIPISMPYDFDGMCAYLLSITKTKFQYKKYKKAILKIMNKQLRESFK